MPHSTDMDKMIKRINLFIERQNITLAEKGYSLNYPFAQWSLLNSTLQDKPF